MIGVGRNRWVALWASATMIAVIFYFFVLFTVQAQDPLLVACAVHNETMGPNVGRN